MTVETEQRRETIQEAEVAPARMAADSSRFGPYNPGASPPASRHISESCPR
jgi:hypothetical protein